VYFWDPKHAFINLPPAFVQELQMQDKISAEVIRTQDGQRGILLRRWTSRN
jgi:hypothetical protein